MSSARRAEAGPLVPSALSPLAHARTPDEVERSLWRAHGVLRVVLLAFALAVDVGRLDTVARPGRLVAVMAGLAVWTVVSLLLYARPAARGWPLLLADLGVAVAAVLLTPLVLTAEQVARHDSTLPTFWVAAPVIAWALARGWLGGVLAAVVVSVADVSIRDQVIATTVGNIFLLLLAAGCVGYVAQLVRVAAAARAQTAELAAAAAERERLARVVHDGVLQVLAYVQRRGAELGGEAAELGRLAGEQEVALRALVQSPPQAEGLVDLARLLAGRAGPAVTVVPPGAPVPLPARVAHELVAAVDELLANVARHCPAGTPAYVLVEDLPGSVVVTVRDEGPGIEPGRLDRAAADGRLGVDRSVRGRLRDVGGQATVTSGPAGTEWELSVPVAAF